MTRYPQSIPGQYGNKCPYCGGRKNLTAKTCRACDPSFSSFSTAREWALQHATGPCSLIHRQYGYQYVEWPRDQKGATA
jgi:hypothetical protein